MPMVHKKTNLPKLPVWFLPVLILLLGGILRLVYLNSMPGGMHQDESFVAWNGFALFHEGMDSAGNVMPVYMADWGDGHSALYVWLLLPLLAMSGGHITPFLIRLPQAAVAVLTLWVVYLLIHRMFGRRPALWSLFLLAICPWHVMMSRWGLDANLAPGFLIFGLYFFVRGLEQERFLLLSALFYGLSLYCYAVIWPLVPIMLALQIIYGLFHKKLHISRSSIASAGILFLLALPLLLFVLVNSDVIPEIRLPFLTIPRMSGYRGSEIAFTPSRMWGNLRTALSLLWHQNTGAPQDVLLPWGLFYDIGRVFIVVGAAILLYRLIRSLLSCKFIWEYYLFVALAGGGINCLLVSAVLHQINSLYIPLVLCEAYGIWSTIALIQKHRKAAARLLSTAIVAVYTVCLLLFQRDYYTSYRQVADAYFGRGIQECVDYAVEQCHLTGIRTITAEKGAQWPRLLLFTETLPSQYLNTVVYDVAPAPASFETEGIRINTSIDYEHISPDSIYIIYYTDAERFSGQYTLTQFYEYWYVAVPKAIP